MEHQSHSKSESREGLSERIVTTQEADTEQSPGEDDEEVVARTDYPDPGEIARGSFEDDEVGEDEEEIAAQCDFEGPPEVPVRT